KSTIFNLSWGQLAKRVKEPAVLGALTRARSPGHSTRPPCRLRKAARPGLCLRLSRTGDLTAAGRRERHQNANPRAPGVRRQENSDAAPVGSYADRKPAQGDNFRDRLRAET